MGAREIVTGFLNQFGLGAMGDWAFSRYTELGGGEFAFSAIEQEMPDRPEFAARFPAYKALAQQGRAMTPAEMLAYERQAAGLMRAAGLPAGFYDTPEDFGALMGQQVSVAELQQRVQLAQNAAFDAPAETKTALRDFYGMSDGDLTASFLDPDRALPLLQNRYVSAQMGGIGRQLFAPIERETAEQLTAAGVNEAQARQGFGELAQQRNLFTQTAGEAAAGEGEIGTAEAVGAQFGTNPNAARRIRQRQQRRAAEFAGGSGFRPTGEGVAGLGPPA